MVEILTKAKVIEIEDYLELQKISTIGKKILEMITYYPEEKRSLDLMNEEGLKRSIVRLFLQMSQIAILLQVLAAAVFTQVHIF
jgi:hypothetical protein